MEIKTEPAGRLLDILKEARGRPAQDRVRKVWANIFGLEENDTGTILRMIADLIQLTYKAKSQIEALDDIDHILYLQPFIQIERMLSQINLETQWQSLQQQIDESTIYGLQFCSDKLNREENITVIKNTEIDEIKKSLTELSDSISNSQLDSSLKLLLLRNLEGLRQSLITYKIKGIEGIKTEIELNLGSLILNKDKIINASKSNESSGFFKKYLDFLGGLNKTVSTANNLDELTGSNLSKLMGIE